MKKHGQDSAAVCPGTSCGRRPHCPGDGACGLCCTRIEHLSVKAGGNDILQDINLHIHCGELTAIVGRNGAGKTTFLRALLNEIPHQGTVRYVNGKGETYSKPRFGYVPQRLQVEKGTPISVSDLITASLFRWPAWFPRKKHHAGDVRRILEKTGAGMLADRRLCDLSGGELQRVMLALAIEPAPDILLLDEPVSGVDHRGLIVFYQLVSDLRRTHDMTILLVSHDLDIVARHADTVVLIDKTVEAAGPPREVFADRAFIETFGKISFDTEQEAQTCR